MAVSALELGAFFAIGVALLLRYLVPSALASWRRWWRVAPATTHLLTVLCGGRRRRVLAWGMPLEELLGIALMVGYSSAVVLVIIMDTS